MFPIETDKKDSFKFSKIIFENHISISEQWLDYTLSLHEDFYLNLSLKEIFLLNKTHFI